MSVVRNTRVEDHWAVQQNYPMWKELPADVTCNRVLTLLDPSDHSCCSVVCKEWNQFLTSKDVWLPLSRNHFPSMTPGFFKSFEAYQRLYSNLPKGVCSVKTLEGHTGGVTSLVLRDATLFSGSSDNTIKIWDLSGSTNTCTATFKGHTGRVCSLALTDTTLFSASSDCTILIWDLKSNTCTATLSGHKDGVTSLLLRDATLFSSSYDSTIKIWDLKSNTCIATLRGHTGEVSSLALRDSTLFSGSYDTTIKIWDLATNTCTATREGHTDWIRSLALKDATLFSSSDDSMIKIWDLRTNTCTATLEGHASGACSLALRGAALFSGSVAGTIQIWDLGSNTCTATLLGHDTIRSLALRDATLFSGSNGNTIKIWDFTASHAEIFMQIANAFEDQDQTEAECAMDRFSKMPFIAKNKIFNELFKIIKSELKPDDQRCAEDVFYGKNGQSATNAQRAEAIRNYLGKLPKS
jgi:WD40 repeat protein